MSRSTLPALALAALAMTASTAGAAPARVLHGPAARAAIRAVADAPDRITGCRHPGGRPAVVRCRASWIAGTVEIGDGVRTRSEPLWMHAAVTAILRPDGTLQVR